MKRPIYVGLLALLLGAGTWQLGQGAWIHLKAVLAQALLEQAWAKSRETGQPTPPWPWADTWPVARMHIQGYAGPLMVLHGDSGRVLAFGPGHAPESALPGRPGTILVSGHRDTHFSALRGVEKGWGVLLETRDGSYRYRVDEVAIVDAERFRIHSGTGERLVLVTCYPFDSPVPGGSRRFVVSAARIPG